jgi:hypothetical protein
MVPLFSSLMDTRHTSSSGCLSDSLSQSFSPQIIRHKPEWSGTELEMLECTVNAIIDFAPPIERDQDRLVSFYVVFYQVAPMCELLKEGTVKRLLQVFLAYLQHVRDDRLQPRLPLRPLGHRKRRPRTAALPSLPDRVCPHF